MSFGVPLFFVVAQPFGLNQWVNENKTLILLGMMLPIFGALCLNQYLRVSLIVSFSKSNVNPRTKEVFWSLWNALTVILFVSIYYLFVPSGVAGTKGSGSLLINGMILGTVPGLICVQYSRIQKSKRKLLALTAAHSPAFKNGVPVSEKVVMLRGHKDSLRLDLSTLLFVQAQDNYVKIVWFEGSSVRQCLLRSTMKHIENQLHFDNMLRCHRSYIVNLSHVMTVSGGTRACRLKVNHHEQQIPVSRHFASRVLRSL